jgi:small subunit ribosomal protein S9
LENIIFAVGKRKESAARVRVIPGEGKIVINGREIDDYFRGLERLKILIKKPFELTQTLGKYDVLANVRGGGFSGQAGAICLGIARALAKIDENFHKILRETGLLTRDPREKERKKYGRKRARRSFQFTKR